MFLAVSQYMPMSYTQLAYATEFTTAESSRGDHQLIKTVVLCGYSCIAEFQQ